MRLVDLSQIVFSAVPGRPLCFLGFLGLASGGFHFISQAKLLAGDLKTDTVFWSYFHPLCLAGFLKEDHNGTPPPNLFSSFVAGRCSQSFCYVPSI